jgi:hypothetical protein
MALTMAQRVAHYQSVFPRHQASWPYVVHEVDREVIYATWLCGQDYQNPTRLYGAYPRIYLPRMEALFPDRQSTLQCFSGVLPESEEYWRLDITNRLGHTEDQGFKEGSVYDAVSLFGPNAFDLILADPPYEEIDCQHYNTPMINRLKALAALAGVLSPGGFLVWLDVMWPIHSKETWTTVGRITIVRSTNHRVRMATIFQRV